MAEQKKAAKKKVFKKNYFLNGFGPVGKGTEVNAEHKKSKDYSDKLTE
jgi:hypothetical protein